MPPLAICSRLKCDLVLPLHGRERGESTPTPRSCTGVRRGVDKLLPGLRVPDAWLGGGTSNRMSGVPRPDVFLLSSPTDGAEMILVSVPAAQFAAG
jgi:hypothetical protein